MRLNREIRLIFKRALREDIGREDITTLFTIPYHFKTESIIIAKEAGVLCGLEIARAVFKERGGSLDFKAFKKDGDVFMNNSLNQRRRAPDSFCRTCSVKLFILAFRNSHGD
jgi:nicotinate-nucleotide pyrophosphorylase